MPTTSRETDQRYENRIDRSDPDGCHPWTDFRNKGGYGRFSVSGRMTLAHRYGWEQLHGPIPPGMKVCHSCDNPPCQNPQHWFLGTQIENIRDREQKGRGGNHRGEQNGRSKLSSTEVAELRRLVASGMSQAEAGRRFGIKRSQANKIIHGASWD